jgi:hypothetical protein
LQQRDVERDLPREKQRWDIRQKDRDEVGVATLDRVPHGRTGKHRDRAQASAALRRDEGCGAAGVQVIEVDALEIRSRGQSVEERCRCRRRAVDERGHAA